MDRITLHGRRLVAVLAAGALTLATGGILLASPPAQPPGGATPTAARTSTLAQPATTPTTAPPAATPATAPPAATVTPAPAASPTPAPTAAPTPMGNAVTVNDTRATVTPPAQRSAVGNPAGTPPQPRAEERISIAGQDGSPAAAGVELVFEVIDPQPGQRYTWEFGDGSYGDGPVALHTYEALDDFAVVLRAGPALQPVARSAITAGPALTAIYASDTDAMITIADEIQVLAAIRAPGASSIGLRMSGAPWLTSRTRHEVQGVGDNFLQVPNFRVDTENEPSLREGIIRTLGGVIPIRNGALVVAIDYTDRAGRERTVTYQPTLLDFNAPTRVQQVEYPDLKRITGLPPDGLGLEGYYLRGDLDFHHPDDFASRKLAIEMGRNGGVFPDDPEVVADNIWKYIGATFGDADPGDFNNAFNVARLIEEGKIVRGRINGGYICISQTYIMTAMTRTLGLPTRELNLAIAKPNYQRRDGVWEGTWFQEAAAHVWIGRDWELYDLWLGLKGFDKYFVANIGMQVWAGYSRQATEFRTVRGEPAGLRGHNFGVFPGDPPHWQFLFEASKPGYRVAGLPDENGAPITGLPENAATYLKVETAATASGPALAIFQPEAKGILDAVVEEP